MEKKFTPQIAAMYLGCEVETPEGRGILYGANSDGVVTVTFGAMGPDFDKGFWNHDVKPILRPYLDMRVEEQAQIQGIFPPMGVFESAELTAYLLSKHFDLFGLIGAGEAVDKTKI